MTGAGLPAIEKNWENRSVSMVAEVIITFRSGRLGNSCLI